MPVVCTAYLMGFNWPDARELPEQRRRRHRRTSVGNRPNPTAPAGGIQKNKPDRLPHSPSSRRPHSRTQPSLPPRRARFNDQENETRQMMAIGDSVSIKRWTGLGLMAPKGGECRNLDVAIPSKVFSTPCLSLTSASTSRFGQPKEPSPMVACTTAFDKIVATLPSLRTRRRPTPPRRLVSFSTLDTTSPRPWSAGYPSHHASITAAPIVCPEAGGR